MTNPTTVQSTMECTKCGHDFVIDEIVTDPLECEHILETDFPNSYYRDFNGIMFESAAGRQRDFLRWQATTLTYRTGVNQGEQT